MSRARFGFPAGVMAAVLILGMSCGTSNNSAPAGPPPPPAERHFAVHEQHCVGLNEADQAAWQAGAASMVEHLTITGHPSQVRARLDQLTEQGVTEVVYQPAGPDVPRELERFLLAATG